MKNDETQTPVQKTWRSAWEKVKAEWRDLSLVATPLRVWENLTKAEVLKKAK